MLAPGGPADASDFKKLPCNRLKRTGTVIRLSTDRIPRLAKTVFTVSRLNTKCY